MGVNPGLHKRVGNLPVENVTFFDAVNFCNALSRAEGCDEAYSIDRNEKVIWNRQAKGYRLPTEKEWEYVLGYTKEELESYLDEIAWYDHNSKRETHPVGNKRSNKYGIHDMIGNVYEWCYDGYSKLPDLDNIYNDTPSRVLKGCSFSGCVNLQNPTMRINKIQYTKDKFTGFRIVI